MWDSSPTGTGTGIPRNLINGDGFRDGGGGGERGWGWRFRMQPHLFNKVMHDICNYDAYFVQKCDATGVLGLLSE
ncbi:hypothetical protein L3X38_033292 [Prunus dulcis]|uniref:Uncharacterized protein n=1 Tax=Prunus dulcis TaxID=3755 RepID=A0AAD4YWU2_PRUDU|nr:hypothetical protein L3X38_033292 [Prunus dulcis]